MKSSRTFQRLNHDGGCVEVSAETEATITLVLF